MKKGVIFRYLLSSACTLSLIGTGFALWIFNGSNNVTKSIQLDASVAGVVEIGDLSITLPTGYDAFHLVLGQANSKYSINGTGVYFTPNININYSNYVLDNRVNTFLVGRVVFNNATLLDYVEAKNPIRTEINNAQTTYVILEEELILDGTEYASSYTPSFGYKINKGPKSSDELSTMITNLSKYKLDSNLSYDLTVTLSIEMRNI